MLGRWCSRRCLRGGDQFVRREGEFRPDGGVAAQIGVIHDVVKCPGQRSGFLLRSFKVVVGSWWDGPRASTGVRAVLGVMLGAECSDSRAEHRATQYHSRVEREVGATMALKAKVREFASSLIEIVRLVSAGVARYPCPYATPACSSRALMGLYTELEAGKGA